MLHEQLTIDVDPIVKDEDPDGHNVQALAPVVVENAPAGHRTHTLALLAPDTPENEPAGHGTHALTLLAPVTFEYVPAEQFTHALPDKYCPAAQVTS